jgi:hypothetical protein
VHTAGELPTGQSRLAPRSRHEHSCTRRSTIPHARTVYVGLDVPKDTIAVAHASEARAADSTSLGTSGTRPCALDTLRRTRPSMAKPPVVVYEAGPWGSWLSRSLTQQRLVCGGAAPLLIPQKAGDWVQTARGDAFQRARLRRSGELPPVDVPAAENEAIRDLSRARADTRHDLQAAKARLKTLLRRQDLHDTGRANWGPAPLPWRSAVVCPTLPSRSSFRSMRGPCPHTTNGYNASRLHATNRSRRSRPGVGSRSRSPSRSSLSWAPSRVLTTRGRSCTISA